MVRDRQPVGGRFFDDYKNIRVNKANEKDVKSPRRPELPPHGYTGKGNFASERQRKAKTQTPPDAGAIKSRREISLITMNMSGAKVMGATPKYKVNMIEDSLRSFPDAVFIQDAVEESELTAALEKVSEGKYEYFFKGSSDNEEEEERDRRRERRSSKKERSKDRRRRKSRDRRHRSDEEDEGDGDDGEKLKMITGMAWNREKYWGTPLQLDDKRIEDYVDWIKEKNLVVVKLDSKERVGIEDVWPSVVAISWHGSDYNTPLRKRSRECEEFFAFLSVLRDKNWHIPMIIGGDFNMDMKSFNMTDHPEYALVPYRPVSGTLAKDLKNTFMYTMDTLQVTETGFKQHHPEIFSNPFISVKVRGRTQVRLWAVVRIQRYVRKWLGVVREREAAKWRQKEKKKRWRKKIAGEEYTDDEEEERSRRRDRKKEKQKHRKDRKYALYWDERDDPRYEENIEKLTPEEYAYRRRKDFTIEGKKSIMDDMYEKPLTVPSRGHRRKKFSDLKSIQDRKREEEAAEGFGFRPEF